MNVYDLDQLLDDYLRGKIETSVYIEGLWDATEINKRVAERNARLLRWNLNH